MRFGTKVAAVGVLACAVAACSGCSGGGAGFESAVRSAAQDSAGAIVLPQAGAPGDGWSELVVLCPYAVAGDVADAAFAAAASGIDTNADDGAQTLLFKHDGEVEAVRVDRARVDFCGAGPEAAPHAGDVFAADASWSVERADGALLLSPR